MISGSITRVVVVAALVLVLQRGLYRRCWSFAAYLVAVLVCGSLMAYWPSRFYTSLFWLASRDLYALLKVFIAIELGVRIVEAFPGAIRRARGVALFLLGGLALAIYLPALSFLPPFLHWPGFQEWRLRLNVGTIWLFAGLALLAAWYNLPLDRWHRALLGGFVAQLVVGSLVLARFDTFAFAVMLDPLVAAWWVWSAWSIAPAPVATAASEPIYAAV